MTFIKTILSIVTIFVLSTQVNAQAELQGNPSLHNFVGSPGMWIVGIGAIVLTAFVIAMRKNAKLLPGSIKRKKTD